MAPPSTRRRIRLAAVALAAVSLLAVGEAGVAHWRGRQFLQGCLAPETQLEVGGVAMPISALARLYEPWISWPRDLEFPPESALWFARERGGRLLLAYRVVRADERHPGAVTNAAYAAWRALYYGSRRDIEYVELLIDRESGRVAAVRFERGDEEGRLVRHVPVELRAVDDPGGGYRVIEAGTATGLVHGGERAQDLRFHVSTWNGLFTARPRSEPGDSRLVSAQLPLAPADLRRAVRYRMWRRSTGWLGRADPAP